MSKKASRKSSTTFRKLKVSKRDEWIRKEFLSRMARYFYPPFYPLGSAKFGRLSKSLANNRRHLHRQLE